MRLVVLMRFDSLLDFPLGLRQIKGRGRLHRRKIDGGVPELGDEFLDTDKPPNFATVELVKLCRCAPRDILNRYPLEGVLADVVEFRPIERDLRTSPTRRLVVELAIRPGEHFSTIVGGEDDDGVVGNTHVIQRLHQGTNAVVKLRHPGFFETIVGLVVHIIFLYLSARKVCSLGARATGAHMKRGTTVIMLLAFAIGLATVSAHAQGMGGGGHKHQKQTDKTEPQKSKADEKAYNAALKSVPNKPKPDPWQGTR
jgi:hypothetical protein